MRWINDGWALHDLPWASLDSYDKALKVIKDEHLKVVNVQIYNGQMRAVLLLHVNCVPDILIALRINT